MKHSVSLLVSIVLLFVLPGCFELIEETSINKDGSGVYKLTLNLSGSQTRLNSLMTLDSINGKKVPSVKEIEKEVTSFANRMNQAVGVSDATSQFSAENWILKFSCSFDSLPALKDAIYESSEQWLAKEKNRQRLDQIELSFKGNKYTRSFATSINEKTRKEVRKDEDFGKLADGKCVFIQRFDQSIKEINQDNVRIAKNKKASMLMVSPIEIFENPSILNYSVKLNP